MRTKLAAGAAVVALPVVAMAAPAAADVQGEDRAEEHIDFNYDDVPHGCTLTASSRFEYREATDTTWITVSNTVSGADPLCFAEDDRVFFGSQLLVFWREPNEPDPQVARVGGVGNGQRNVSHTFSVDGRIDDLQTDHEWRYACDYPREAACIVTLETQPK